MIRSPIRLATLALAWAASVPSLPATAEEVRFHRDIRPILADKCFRCHGIDPGSRQADLRLDQREDAIRAGAIEPGKPEASELWRRITAEGKSRMPPPDSGLVLQPADRELLRQWITHGAPYEPHWAFTPPRQLPLPPVSIPSWRANPIDAWVLAGLEARGLAPSPPADRAALLRRLHLVLTGLPPTIAEYEAFQQDERPDAVHRAVEHLLSSPHYAERLTLEWLDAARYADTNGYFQDLERTAWPWRDWVLRAFQENMPFDQFTREQMAGDLLPQPTSDQLVATGFHRNHMVTNETGVIEEEYRISYVADRVETMGTAWLGLTLGCARCHDHKYDPVTQADYFRFFAFFNSLDETGLVRGAGSPPPVLSLASPEQQSQLRELQSQRKQLQDQLAVLEPQLAADESKWLESASLPPAPAAGLAAYFPLDGETSDQGPQHWPVRSTGDTMFAPGIVGKAGQYNVSQYQEFDGPRLETQEAFSLSVWLKAGSAPVGYVLTKMDRDAGHRGLEVNWYKSMPRISLVNTWRRNAVEVQSADPVGSGAWHHLVITYDGSSRAAGIKMFLDGSPQATTIRRDDLTGPIGNQTSWAIGYKSDGLGWDGGIDELRWYHRVLSASEVQDLFWHDVLHGAVDRPSADRLPPHRERLRAYYLDQAGSAEARQLRAKLDETQRQETALNRQLTATSVMKEIDSPRETFVLRRGQYDQPGEPVLPGFPTSFRATTPTVADPAVRRLNRLDLANWLLSSENPLTARVIVNRFWQQLFGEGLVRTPNDFGVQGDLPSHPELLDWLAVDFRESGWDIKRLMRLMATSQTFQQSSQVSPEVAVRDPENRWLGRGPRYRLSGEILRDQALAASGLLVLRVGGPSVKPYQPPGLWEEVSYNADQTYEVDAGAGRYRRSLYTYWKRQAPPPALLTFDSPTRETCAVRRPRTNTPLQALVLLNDPTYVEAARSLARDLLLSTPPDDVPRLRSVFHQVVGRSPLAAELTSLQRFLAQQRAAYETRPSEAQRLLTGDSTPAHRNLTASEWASWTLLVSVLLNLDETITIH